MKNQYITDDAGKKVAVIVPVKDYEKLLDDLDEMRAIKAYDSIKEGKTEFVPATDVFKRIETKRKIS